jgi:hypothetical protein
MWASLRELIVAQNGDVVGEAVRRKHMTFHQNKLACTEITASYSSASVWAVVSGSTKAYKYQAQKLRSNVTCLNDTKMCNTTAT